MNDLIDIQLQALTWRNNFAEYIEWLDDANYIEPFSFMEDLTEGLKQLKANIIGAITEQESIELLNA